MSGPFLVYGCFMPRILPFVVLFVITVYAFISCAFFSSEDLPWGLSKRVCFAFLILTVPLGPVVWCCWLFVRRFDNMSVPSFDGVSSRFGRKKKGVVAPDDDEDFLFTLDRDLQLRREGKRRDRVVSDDVMFGGSDKGDNSHSGDGVGDVSGSDGITDEGDDSSDGKVM